MGSSESFPRSLSAAPSEVSKGFEESRRNFEKAADVIADIVEEVHGMKVPEETVRQWRTLMSAIRVVDDRIDHTQDTEKRQALVEQIKASLLGESVDFSDDPNIARAMRQIEVLAEELGEERAHFMNTMFSLILRVTEDIRTESDPQEVVRLTMLEGQMTTKLFLPFLPESFKQGEQYQKLVHTLSRIGRGANCLDTFADLSTDYENDAVVIEPTVANRVLFLGGALTYAPEMAGPVIKSPKLAKEIVWAVLASLKNGSEKKKK